MDPTPQTESHLPTDVNSQLQNNSHGIEDTCNTSLSRTDLKSISADSQLVHCDLKKSVTQDTLGNRYILTHFHGVSNQVELTG